MLIISTIFIAASGSVLEARVFGYMLNGIRYAREFRLGIRAKLLASQSIGQILPIAAIPILTRLVNPAEMGHYQIGLSIALVALPFAVFQADVFLAVAYDADEARKLLHRALFSTAVVGLAATAVASILPTGGGAMAAISAITLLIVMSITSLTNAILIRKNDMSKLVQRNILGGALVALTQTIFALIVPNAISLSLGMLVGRFICQIILTSSKGYDIHPDSANVPKDFWRALAGSGANAMGTFASQMPMLLVAPLYGSASAGYLGLGQRVVGAPTGLIGQGVNQIIISDASAVIRSGRPELWGTLRRHIFLLLSLSLIAALVIAVIIPPLTPWIFGKAWAPAGVYIRILALPMCLQLAAVPIMPLMTMLKMQTTMVSLQIFRIVTILACIGYAGWKSLSMGECVLLISVSWTLAYLLSISLSIAGMKRFDSQNCAN